MAFHPERPLRAVELLVEGLTDKELRSLKIWSGEHVAAIVATMLHLQAPTAVDTAGQPDLEFRIPEPGSTAGRLHAYEAKSVPGAYRPFLARVDDDGAPQAIDVEVKAIDTIIREVRDTVRAADRLLGRKVPDNAVKHVIVVLHPLDAFPVELGDEIAEVLLGAAISVGFEETDLQTVTVAVVPDGSLAQWTHDVGWQSIMFIADADDSEIELQHPIMRAEAEFMSLVHPTRESPFNTRLLGVSDDPAGT